MPELFELRFDLGGFESVENGILVEWLVLEGDTFCKDDVIAVIETYKSVVEFSAEFGGKMVKHCFQEGDTIQIPTHIALVLPDAEKVAVGAEPDSKTAIHQTPQSIKLSPAAKRFLRERNVPVKDFKPETHRDFFREQDVQEWFEKSISEVDTVRSTEQLADLLFLFQRLKNDEDQLQTFANLNSELKIRILLSIGAEIGANVLIEKGALALGARMTIGADTVIKKGTIFLGEEIAIGDGCFFEKNSNWVCRRIMVGNSFYCAAETRVGWGEEWGSRAVLKIGDHCFVGEQAMLNPGRGIFVGNEVAIGAGTKVYTHQFWQSVLHGYHAAHKGVRFESNIQIGANVVILPGSMIEEGVTVAANSLINGTVKRYRLVGGIPAVTLQKGTDPLHTTPEELKKILEFLMAEFSEAYNLNMVTDDSGWVIHTKIGRISDHPIDDDGGYTIIVCLEGTDLSPQQNQCLFDLKNRKALGKRSDLSDVLREFLRKRGIRFTNDNWRYQYKEIEL